MFETDRRVNYSAYYNRNTSSHRGNSIHSYGKVHPFGDCAIVIINRKTGKPIRNGKFHISPAEDRLLFGKIENKIYTTNKNGEIFFSNVSEQKISIDLRENFSQFHRLRLGREKVYVTLSLSLSKKIAKSDDLIIFPRKFFLGFFYFFLKKF